MITINFKKILLGMSLLGALAGTQAFAASKERGNGGTGLVFRDNNTTIADTYYKAEYEPFELEKEVKEELEKIHVLTGFFKLSLPNDFWKCDIFDNCDGKGLDIRLVKRLPIENIVNLDKSKMTASQIQELQYVTAYGYSTKETTWLVKSFYQKLSTKDKALAYLHERMHTLNDANLNHEYIMWYISGISKLMDISIKKEKYTAGTFEYLKKYTYFSYRKITGAEVNYSNFQNFKYAQNNKVLFFYNASEQLEEIKKIESKLIIENGAKKVKFIVIDDFFKVNVEKSTLFAIKLKPQLNFCNFSGSFSVKGKNNKIIIDGGNYISGDVHYYSSIGPTNGITDFNYSIKGDNNVINTTFRITIIGSNNVISKHNKLMIEGNSNFFNNQYFYYNGYDVSTKPERINNKMLKADSKLKKNDHQEETLIIEAVDRELKSLTLESGV